MCLRDSSDFVGIAEDITSSGFAVVERTADIRDAYEDLYEVGLAFFRLAEAQKLLCAMPSATNTGYTPVGVEYSISPDVPDQKESVTYVPAEAAVAAGHPASVQLLYATM